MRIALALLVGVIGCNEPAKGGPSASASVSAAAPPPVVASVSAAPAVSSAPAKVPDAISAQHVLVAFKGATNAPKSITRSREDARKRAEEVVAKAKAGEDFTSLVAAFSDDASTKDRQGNLGKFARDKMVKPFSDVAFALAVGEVSAPVETPFGYHVIKRNQ